MRETVISRTAFVAAAGTALLTLAGCGGQQAQDTTGFNDDRPVKDKMDAGSSSGDSGDAGGGADTDSGSADAFDTWSDDCWDAHRNISIAALLELKGWQLQEFASQQGYTWQDALEMYENRQVACSASAISARMAQPNGSARMKSESSTRAAPGVP